MRGFERLFFEIWMLEPGRDDKARVDEETARAVPLLIDVLRPSAADPDERGRAALLLGLIAEGRGDPPSAAVACRAELRKGIPTYLDALGSAGSDALVAALCYLLAHFPEDERVILEALTERDDRDPAFAQMRRALDPPSALRRLGNVEELTTSTLAEMGARAAAALALPDAPAEAAAPSTPPSAVGLAQRLMEDRGLVKLYESHLRPQFLRVMGRNWADDLTAEDEDAYILQAPPPAPGPVLDLACGAGRWTRVVAEKAGARRTIGLDLSWPMLLESRALLPEVPFVLGDALRLPFADGVLGGVNCSNALQVLPHPEEVIRELARCMRRDAVLTCFTFRRAPRSVYRYFQSRFERATGVQAFREDDVRRWLADAGMAPIDVSGPNLCLFFTARKG